jgi:hypothetical protein
MARIALAQIDHHAVGQARLQGHPPDWRAAAGHHRHRRRSLDRHRHECLARWRRHGNGTLPALAVLAHPAAELVGVDPAFARQARH